MKRFFFFVAVQLFFTLIFLFGKWQSGIIYDFHLAHPIGHKENHFNAYFFKKFVLETLPKAAWMVAAAPDSFEIYLNGRSLGQFFSPGQPISGVFNLSGILKRGENFLAVSVKRRSIGIPWFRAELHFYYAGKEKVLFTDSSWLFLSQPPSEAITPWYLFYPARKYQPASILTNLSSSIRLIYPPEAVISSKKYSFTSTSTKMLITANFGPTFGKKIFLTIKRQGVFELNVNNARIFFSQNTALKTEIFDLSGILNPFSQNTLKVRLLNMKDAPFLSIKIINSNGEEVPLKIKGNVIPCRDIDTTQKIEFFPSKWYYPIFNIKGLLSLVLIFFPFWVILGIGIKKLCPDSTLIESSLLTFFFFILNRYFFFFKGYIVIFIVNIALIFLYSFLKLITKKRKISNLSCKYLNVLAYIFIIVGVLLRIYFLDKTALSVDEHTLISYAKGILERGYPSKFLGKILNPLCTYEFSAYILSLFLYIGLKDLGVRFSGILASSIVMFLLWNFGKKIFSPQVAILALIFYVFSPIAIHFGPYVFHVQYDQLLYTIAGILLFLWWLKEKPPSLLKSCLFAIICGLLYLSWEGSIFIVPVFAVLILWNYGLSIIKNKSFIAFVFVVSIIIFLQFTWRTLNSFPYLLLGLTPFYFTPTLAFLHPQFNPWFIFEHYFFSFGYITLFILACLSVIFYRNIKSDIVTFLLFFLPSICIYLFLLHPLSHYFYFLFPFLCLSAARGVDLLVKKFSLSRVIIYIISFILISPWPLKITFGFFPQELYYHRFPDFIWVEYRLLHQHLQKISSKETVLVHTAPHVIPETLTFKKVYFLNLTPLITTFYDSLSKSGFYYDKFQGKQVISSLRYLKNIVAQENEICIYIFNYDRFKDYVLPELNEFIVSFFEPIYEDGNAILYCRMIK